MFFKRRQYLLLPQGGAADIFFCNISSQHGGDSKTQTCLQLHVTTNANTYLKRTSFWLKIDSVITRGCCFFFTLNVDFRLFAADVQLYAVASNSRGAQKEESAITGDDLQPHTVAFARLLWIKWQWQVVFFRSRRGKKWFPYLCQFA